MRECLTDERGSASGFVAVVALALVMVAGMAYDGGQIVRAQSEARDLAANAARAGAQELDVASVRSTGRATLDPARATAAAERYLVDAGHAGIGSVEVSADTVTVRVGLRQEMRILPVADRTVVAVDTATAVPGLEEAQR